MLTASQQTHVNTCKGRGVALGIVPASNHSEKALCQTSCAVFFCGHREGRGFSPSLVLLHWISSTHHSLPRRPCPHLHQRISSTASFTNKLVGSLKQMEASCCTGSPACEKCWACKENAYGRKQIRINEHLCIWFSTSLACLNQKLLGS